MLARVQHREDACFGEVGESQVPLALQEFCANLVDLFESVEISHAHFGRRESNYGTVLLMQLIDVEDALASDYGALET